MNHGSLFSGIGGFDLAAHWLGWRNVFQVENASGPRENLRLRFPEAKLYGDIHDFDGRKYRGTIDVLSGGFPCQPYSTAGKRRGKEDDRHLWPEMRRVISEVKPTWLVGENVTGIIKMELDDILAEMEAEGYEVQPFNIPAIAVEAPHKRARVWIIAHSFDGRSQERRPVTNKEVAGGSGEGEAPGNVRAASPKSDRKFEHAENHATVDELPLAHGWRLRQQVLRETHREESDAFRHDAREWPEVAAALCRVDDGVPRRVDRLRGLGNAIDPWVAYEIFNGIQKVEESLNVHKS